MNTIPANVKLGHKTLLLKMWSTERKFQHYLELLEKQNLRPISEYIFL